MSLKIALFAALCVAQSFAFRPPSASRGKEVLCGGTAWGIAHGFEETVNEIDEVRETVSATAMDAYARGTNFEIVVACFGAQRGSYVALGERISEMVRAAAQEMGTEMRGTAEKYAQLLEKPLMTIAITLRNLPETVSEYLENKQYLKALEAMKEARRIVEENGRKVGELMQQFVEEVPPMADRAEEMASEIREEARKGSEAIRKAFGKCIEEGGPKAVEADEE